MTDAPTTGAPQAEGHSPHQERPLVAYTVLTGAFAAGCGAFAAWMQRSGRRLPERVEAGDLVLITIATHKASRLIAKDRVASGLRAPFTRFQGDAGPGEVDEVARGHGLRLALGELLTCPYCMGMWVAAGFIGGIAVTPRPTRWVASLLTVLTGADALQIAYSKGESSL